MGAGAHDLLWLATATEETMPGLAASLRLGPSDGFPLIEPLWLLVLLVVGSAVISATSLGRVSLTTAHPTVAQPGSIRSVP